MEARAAAPGPLRVRAVELIHVRLALARPFRTARSTTVDKDALLVRVVTDDAEGWGECAAEVTPAYAGETLAGARLVIRDHLAPRLFAGASLADVRGNPFARAAIEVAVLDAFLRGRGQSLAQWAGGTRTHVEAGVAIGMADDLSQLRELAAGYVAEGYRRLKLKIEPGADLDVVAAVRDEVGPDVALAVDANGSYGMDDVGALRALDDFGLQCIEQPLAPDALRDHATVAGTLRTRIALDETITSARVAADALALGACAVVNVKPGRVGGWQEAVAVHDVAVAVGAPAIIGGMLSTGVGRAVEVALASLPGFTEAGDCSASDRYFADDITEPFVLDAGMLAVPDGPGIGVTPRPDRLRRVTVARETLTAQ
jgi:O-succinylbenzoate synthase